MWRKRVSMILFLMGIALCLSVPVHGLWSALINSNTIEAYEEQALDYQKSPELVESIEKQLNEGNIQGIEDPFGNSTATDPEGTLPEEAVGFVKMPKINEIIPLYMGASDRNLANGCAHITGTDLPLSGKGTHTFIAGHRGYYGPTYFLYVDYLVPGDLIYVSYLGKEAVYAVTGNELIDPTDGAKLTERKPNEEWLTLLTCHPFPTALQRLPVHSRRLSDEEIKNIKVAEPIHTDDSIQEQSENVKNLDSTNDSEIKASSMEVNPEGMMKKIGEIGKHSIWLYMGLLVVGGSIFILVFWQLIGTWL